MIVVLIFVLCFASYLAYHLVAIREEHQLVSRSQSWNKALALAEAGIEEGLAQLNSSSSTPSGWTTGTRIFDGGSYSVTIVSSNGAMVVTSAGSDAVPITGDKITRTVQVKARSEGLVPAALSAVYNISFNGNGIATDSFNSHDSNLSTNGQYWAGHTSTNGNVASEYGLVDLGQHTIDGSLYLGPTADYSSGTNQVLGTIFTDYNVQFPDVSVPTNDANGVTIPWQTAPITTIYVTNTTTKGHTTTVTVTSTTAHDFTTSGYYIINDSDAIIVEPGVTVNLDVKGLSFSPSAIQIHGGTANSGTAYVYLDGPTSVGIAGNTAIDASNRPENLWYFGLPSLTSVTYSGDSTFVGVIYAPEADLTLNGGGGNIGLIGASTTKTVTMNGHYNFHYDEWLSTLSPSRGYIPFSWQEL